MSELLDEAYLTWLYGQVGSVKLTQKSRTYWGLLKQLYTTPFVWFVPNDDNRAEDGKYLRYEFCRDVGAEPSADWMDLDCSMLELLIGLSRRLSFEAEGEARGWFWKLIENIDVGVNDRDYNPRKARIIAEKLVAVVTRQYSPTGRGGLFPLNYPERDQRDVEIWYQLNAYLLELD